MGGSHAYLPKVALGVADVIHYRLAVARALVRIVAHSGDRGAVVTRDKVLRTAARYS
jgi:hypothetical protein